MGQSGSLTERLPKQTMTRYNEISHPTHPQHKLKLEYTKLPFHCNGCKEVGIGSVYRCSFCTYDLHTHCAQNSHFFSHAFYPKCSFQFLFQPPGNTRRFCNACEKDVTGFVYHCNACGFDLHPCCAKLPMVHNVGELKLYLYKKVSAPCDRCGKKGRSWSWSYRSACKKYNFHVACVKEMVVESWNETGGISGIKVALPTTTHQHKSKGKVQKGCEMAGLVLQFVISAVLGDPTALIGGVIGAMIS